MKFRAAAVAIDEYDRPTTRGECEDEPRPCPFVSCKYHLYLDVYENLETDRVKVNFPDREVWELEESCALDIADRNGASLEDVGKALNVVRERARQIEALALKKVKAAAEAEEAEQRRRVRLRVV